jgi:hypothetical protein
MWERNKLLTKLVLPFPYYMQLKQILTATLVSMD